MRDARFDVLFEPVRIGPKLLRNRFYAVPHSTGWGSHMPESHARFSATAAAGGWAAVSVAIASIAPESDRNPVPSPARLWDDDDVANLALVCRAGARARRARRHRAVALRLERGPLAGPHRRRRSEPVPERRISADVSARAAPVRDTRTGRLLCGRRADAPATPASTSCTCTARTVICRRSSSRRSTTGADDEYGGALSNRSRFWREAIEAVRGAVDGRCAVAVRIGIDPSARTGCSPEETAEFIRIVDDAVDLWDVNTSVIGEPWLDMRPSRLAPQGYQLEWVARIRDATSKPIVGVGRLTDPEQMAAAVRSGTLDLIGARSAGDRRSRTSLGRSRRGAPMRSASASAAMCAFSASASPTTRLHPKRDHRRGVPPRLAPRALHSVARLRSPGADRRRRRGRHGMRDRPRPARRPQRPSRRRCHRPRRLCVDDREAAAARGMGTPRRLATAQLEKLGVEVSVGTKWDASLVAAHEARTSWSRRERTGVATAPAISRTRRSPAGRQRTCTTPEVVLGDPAMRPERALVYDCEGYLVGVGIAELLAERGAHVTYVTSHAVVAPTLDRTFEGCLDTPAPQRARGDGARGVPR